LDNVLFDVSEILDGSNQHILLLNAFTAIIGRRGGNSMKKITLWKHFLDENNLEMIFNCKILYLIVCLIFDEPD